MKEQLLDPPVPVDCFECDHCGKKNHPDNQVFTLIQERPKVTREWRFDTLKCLRAWAAPTR